MSSTDWYTPVNAIPSIVSDLRSALAKTAAHGSAMPPRSLAWRRQQLSALYDLTMREEDALTQAMYADLKRSPEETCFFDIYPIRSEIVTAVKHLDEWTAPEPVHIENPAFAFDRAEIRPRPRGLVLIIGTWNYPVNLTFIPLISAIAAGNAVVIKLSEVCANTSKLMAKLISKYLDTEYIRVVCGAVPESTTLLDQRFDLIFYTGNANVARVVMKAAAKNLTPVVLELGGKSPVIVDRDIDVKVAAKRIMWGKMVNAGQTCIAPDHVYIHKDVAKDFYAAVPVAVRELMQGDPETSTYFARIGSKSHFERLAKTLETQIKMPDVEVVYGGKVDPTQQLIVPTVIRGVSFDDAKHPTMTSELFGPILPVIEYDSVDDVIQLIQSRKEPALALYPFSRNSAFIERVFDTVDSGNAIANDFFINMCIDTLPFGGMGESGMGAYHGKHGFDTFSHRRSTLIRSPGMELLNELRYPYMAYDRKSYGYAVVRWLFSPALPSRYVLAIRAVYRRVYQYVRPFGVPLVFFVGLFVGSLINRR